MPYLRQMADATAWQQTQQLTQIPNCDIIEIHSPRQNIMNTCKIIIH